MRSDPNVRSFVGVEIQLHGCVDDPDKLLLDLRGWLESRFEVDYDDDIELSCTSTPNHNP